MSELPQKRTYEDLMQNCQKDGDDESKVLNENSPAVIESNVVFGTWKEDDIPADSTLFIEGKKTSKVIASFKLEKKEGIPTCEGSANVEYTMHYSHYDPNAPHEADAHYSGIMKVSGKVFGKEGEFLCQDLGRYANFCAKSILTIIPNSGTKELEGIQGYGEFVSAYGSSSFLKLYVTFASKGESSSFETDRKKIATEFLQLSCSGQCDKAYEHVDMVSFKHHNIHFAGDAKSLKDAQQESANKMPNKVIDIKTVVQEGDLVTTWSLVTMSAEMKVQVCHMFRFDSRNRVVELWDMGQIVPEKIPNENGPL